MPQPRNNKQYDLEHILGLIIRRRYIIAVPILLSLIISVMVSYLIPKEYEAYSTLLVRNKRIVDPLVRDLSVSPDIRMELNTLSKQVLSWDNLNELAAEANLGNKITSPVEREEFILTLRKRINVEFRGDELIQISYRDRKPETARLVVNLLTQSFIDQHANVKKQEAQNAIDFIGEQLKIYRNKLQSSQADFSATKIESELRLAQNRRKLLKERISNLQKFVPPQVSAGQNPLIAQLQSELGKCESELARLMIDAKEGNPRVIELENLISEIKKKISAETKKGAFQESVSITNPSYLQADQELKTVEMEIEYLNKRQQELKNTPRETKNKVTEEDLVALGRSKQVDEDIYQLLLKQLEAAYVSERLQDTDKGDRFTVLEYARLPLTPVKPDKKMVVVTGLLMGLMLVAGVIAILEFIDKSFRTVEDANETLPITFLGYVSKMVVENSLDAKPWWLKVDEWFIWKMRRNRWLAQLEPVAPYLVSPKNGEDIDPTIAAFNEPRRKISEEFRLIRANITSIENKSPVVIMVTSSCMGEGKTTVAANLAVGFAQNGKKTVIVDCDIRKGKVHQLLGVEKEPGLADALKNNAPGTPVPIGQKIKNLSVVARGCELENPSEFLYAEHMGRVIANLKKNFEIIIVDVPPVLNLPDVSVLSPQADSVIMVVQMERTQREHVLSAYNALKKVNANVLGYILTNTRYYLPRYLYGYYYGEESV